MQLYNNIYAYIKQNIYMGIKYMQDLCPATA